LQQKREIDAFGDRLELFGAPEGDDGKQRRVKEVKT
jgi:hypothetical protein